MLQRLIAVLVAFGLAAPTPVWAGAREVSAPSTLSLVDLPVLPPLPALPPSIAPTAGSALEARSAAPGAGGADAAASAAAPSAARALDELAAGARPASGVPLSPELADRVIDKTAASAEGPSVEAPAARSPQLYAYSLDKPITLSRPHRIIHYASQIGWHATKIWLAYRFTGPANRLLATLHLGLHVTGWMSVGIMTLDSAWGFLAGLALTSSIDLAQLYWRQRLSTLRRLAHMPGVASVKVLSGSELLFSGPLVGGQVERGMVLVESSRPPAEDPVLGRPLPIDAQSTRLRVDFGIGENDSPVSWSPTLAEVLAGNPLPPEIASIWRSHLEGELLAQGRLKRWRKGSLLKKASLRLAVLTQDGQERAFGALGRGASALKLIGSRHAARLRWWLIALPARNRAIPITQTKVVSEHSRGRPGRWIDWLLGREVVVRR